MAEVISLREAREKRRVGAFDSLAEFDASVEVLFEAVDLLEGSWNQKAREARQKVCEGIELLLKREERLMSWTSR